MVGRPRKYLEDLQNGVTANRSRGRLPGEQHEHGSLACIVAFLGKKKKALAVKQPRDERALMLRELAALSQEELGLALLNRLNRLAEIRKQLEPLREREHALLAEGRKVVEEAQWIEALRSNPNRQVENLLIRACAPALDSVVDLKALPEKAGQ